MHIERRKFLESTCKACLLAGAGIFISNLTACSPSTQVTRVPVTDNTVRFPITVFAANPLQIIRPEGWYYDIAVRTTGDGQYEALLLECTHQQNQLISVPHGYKCTLHGSQFALNGQVVKGPAERPLKNYKTSVDQGQLVIHLKS